ncbi:c-type cytochrome [Sphingomonas sp. Y38-1Y]|uniref:c-type cytochrome n=1 Tax=Sphingomonas sp. Y38-1Y TaxID=3078265 RepID=UPI0028E690B9|nr:c-type cytochrome [Sphingomonas sp. Y38-1Y]
MSDLRRGIWREFFPRKIRHWLVPIGTMGLVGLIGAMLLAMTGVLNLAASTPHPQGWASFLHFAFQRSVAFHSRNLQPPAEINSAALIEKGATHYDRVCSNCHGAPGMGQNPIAMSMRPQPQYLMGSLKDYSPSELFWIVKHGVKYSAMPAWPAGDRDDEVWAMVAFLRAMKSMNYEQYRSITLGAMKRATGAPPALPPGDFRPQPYVIGGTQTAEAAVNFSTPALGFGHSSEIAEIGKSCVACHGTDGRSRASGGIPNIALLNRNQIVRQLDLYRTGVRQSGIMQNVAVQLTPDQIAGLASYYSSQPKVGGAKVRATPAVLALGERIASQGLPDRQVGACASCHGITAAAARAYPGLDGQYPLYLRDQLRLYRSGVRGGDIPANPMPAVAARMTDKEIEAVSLFYASRSLGTAPVRAVDAPVPANP